MEDEERCPTCKLIWRLMVLATMGILMGMAWAKMGTLPQTAAIEEVKS